jgi:hypothetical protein
MKINKANNKIEMYLHCKQCLTQKPLGVSLNEYRMNGNSEFQGYDVGWTKVGIQVWCRKHNSNMLHIDFEGQQHPAVTYCKPKKERRNYVKH